MYGLTGSRRWISREEIAEIYDALAEKQTDHALNVKPGDIGAVVDHLAIQADLEKRAQQIRDIELLSNPLGARTA